MTEVLIEVLFEDDDLLVVHKPAGLVCHPTKGDALSSLVSRLRLYRRDQPVFLINRLDRETSGVTLAAKSSAVAGELGRLFESRAVHKRYQALVEGNVAAERGEIDAPLGKALDSPVAIQDAVCSEGAPARTEFEVMGRFVRDGQPFSHLAVVPATGRKHQIRIHLAHIGHPVVGDKIYGGDPTRYLRFVEGVLTPEDRAALRLGNQALHAGELGFTWRERPWRFQSEPEAEFLDFLAGRGGSGVGFA
ncbi:MAG: RluA family pseudouridine synthase [Limisphaerales bacterium]